MSRILWVLVVLWGCSPAYEGRVPSPFDPPPDTPVDVPDSTPPPPTGPFRYPADALHGPVTAEIAAGWRAVASRDDTLQDDVFMKIGASSTVSSNTLACFATGDVDLDVHLELEPTLDYFLAGDAAGSTPFDRETLAARSGRTAAWVIDGDPSPLEQEIAAVSPSLALVHYGTNDMQMGSTYASAMPSFYAAMNELLDQLEDRGILPIVFGITRREDRASADRWVPTYNTVIRGLAEARQLPWVDLGYAIDDLPHPLSGDGLHLRAHPDGACILTPDGLDYGYNVRNLVSLEALDRVKQAALDDRTWDETAPVQIGEGSPTDPRVIDTLPYTDSRDTSASAWGEIDTYSCDGADESGPEYWYVFETQEEVPLRILVNDLGDVDVDLHLLDASATADGCLARGHRVIETRVDPGVYYVVVDTWVDDDGIARSGPYQLAIVRCDADDADCA